MTTFWLTFGCLVFHKHVVLATKKAKGLRLSVDPCEMNATTETSGAKSPHARVRRSAGLVVGKTLTPCDFEAINAFLAFDTAPKISPGRHCTNIADPCPVIAPLARLLVSSNNKDYGSSDLVYGHGDGVSYVTVDILKVCSLRVAHALTSEFNA